MSCRGVGVGNSSSHLVPLPVLDGVIPVVKDDDIDAEASPINSPNYYVPLNYFFYCFDLFICYLLLSILSCFLCFNFFIFVSGSYCYADTPFL
jgi:hypothetical protein